MGNIVLWLALAAIAALALGVLYRRGFRAGTRAPKSRPSTPISLQRIEQQLAKLRTHTEAVDALSLRDLPHHGCPNAEQWMALLEHQPLVAHSLIHQLYMRLYQAGMTTEIAVITSIEAYHAAQAYRTTNASATMLSRPLWEAYPTEAEWQQLLQSDPNRARRLASLMHLQQARFGLSTPVALEESLETFHRVIKAVASENGPAAASP